MELNEEIALCDINESNFRAVIELELSVDQQAFVAPNVKSLAECYLYRNDGVQPFAIMKGDFVIGFALLDIDDDDLDVTIWRIMIGLEHQNKGYGKKAILLLIEWVAKNTVYTAIFIDYVLGNEQAKHLYESLGFVPDRINEHGEQVMVKHI